jgi:hypothetical protein
MASTLAALLRASLLILIAGYRRWVSPALPQSCRFHPSCSEYASEAIAAHGVARGVLLALRRLLRCHPGCEGGVDPVPPAPRRAAPNASASARPEAVR